MHLGFDAKRLFNNFTGLGNYSRTLLRELAELAPEHSYSLFSPRAPRNEETAFFLDNPSYQYVSPPSSRRLFWRSWGVKKDILRHNIDLFHGLSHELPIGLHRTGVKSIVTIHDLIYRLYPKQYKPWDNFIYNQKFRYSCQYADRIVAISESTKQDIQRLFGTPSDKIEVIYQTCDDRFLLQRAETVLADIREKYQLPASYSLYVGSLVERKNLLGLTHALAMLPPDLRPPLVVVGGGGDRYRKMVVETAKRLGVADRLLFRRISFTDLPAVYQSSHAFLYPSFYEGFGIPVIEALNSGVPVLTSNRSSLPEAGGPDSLLIDPADTEAIAAGWERLLTDEALTTKMRQKGRAYSQRFRSEVITPQWLSLYTEVVNS